MKLTETENSKVINYLKLYGKMYDRNLLEYIINNYEEAINKKDRLCELNQIYACLGILPRQINTYMYYIKQIMKKHNINSNILEIGGGYYPILAKYISIKQQRCKNGNITVYDPNLVISKMEHVTLKREKFTSKTNISNYELLIGVMPSEATIDLVKQATRYHKELFLVLNEFTYFTNGYLGYEIPNLKEWEEYIRELIHKDTEAFAIKESRIPNEYGKSYLIFDKKKKM